MPCTGMSATLLSTAGSRAVNWLITVIFQKWGFFKDKDVRIVFFRTVLNPVPNLANILWIIYRSNIYSSQAKGSLKGHISFCVKTCRVGFLLMFSLHVWALKVKCFLLPKAASVQTLNKDIFSSCPFLLSRNCSSLSSSRMEEFRPISSCLHLRFSREQWILH